jgi:hypothetical protein
MCRPVRSVRLIGPDVSVRVAANIRRERMARRLSRPEMTARLAQAGYRMSEDTLCNIEHGVSTPSGHRPRLVTVDELVAVAGVFGISPMKLLSLDE